MREIIFFVFLNEINQIFVYLHLQRMEDLNPVGDVWYITVREPALDFYRSFRFFYENYFSNLIIQ